MNPSDDLSPAAALEEIGRMRRHVGRSAKWSCRLFLIWGVAAVFYWSAIFFGQPVVCAVAGISWVAMTVWSVVYTYRQGVYAPDYSHMTRWVTIAWIITFVGAVVFSGYVLPEHPSGWWIAAGLIVAVVTALPVLYAAWRLRPWKDAR
jgi:hypothetical protein